MRDFRSRLLEGCRLDCLLLRETKLPKFTIRTKDQKSPSHLHLIKMPTYVVVGASRGLGYEWLRHLSADKANVVIGLARTPTSVDAKLAADSITNVHVLQADMVDHESLTTAANEIAKLTNSSVDYLITNGAYQNHKAAGVTPMAFTGNEDMLREEMKRNLDVNVVGVMFAINAFLPLVRKSSIKKIIVLSSGMADVEFVAKAEIPFSVAYAASKAAVNMVVVKYSVELKGEGIILLALSPGVIDTRVEPRKCSIVIFLSFIVSSCEK